MKLTDGQKVGVVQASVQWSNNTAVLWAALKREVPAITDKHQRAVMNAHEVHLRDGAPYYGAVRDFNNAEKAAVEAKASPASRYAAESDRQKVIERANVLSIIADSLRQQGLDADAEFVTAIESLN